MHGVSRLKQKQFGWDIFVLPSLLCEIDFAHAYFQVILVKGKTGYSQINTSFCCFNRLLNFFMNRVRYFITNRRLVKIFPFFTIVFLVTNSEVMSFASSVISTL